MSSFMQRPAHERLRIRGRHRRRERRRRRRARALPCRARLSRRGTQDCSPPPARRASASTSAAAALPIEELAEQSLRGVDLALFSAGSSISKRYAPLAARQGTLVIDNSSAFRMDPTVPLVIPEINAAARAPSITASSPIPTAPPSSPSRRCGPSIQLNPIRRLIVSTYQAASGAGAAAMQELRESTRAFLEDRPYAHKVLPHPYAFNLFSHNTRIDAVTGYNEEETKVIQETRKIFADPGFRITATCVRVPVLRAHCVALNFECDAPISAARCARFSPPRRA
jgi:aspartate-semialdehyde dehydrogenase